MAQHAKLLERRFNAGPPAKTQLLFQITDDTAGVLGEVLVADGPPSAVKAALQQEATRLLSLPVGIILDL